MPKPSIVAVLPLALAAYRKSPFAPPNARLLTLLPEANGEPATGVNPPVMSLIWNAEISLEPPELAV